MASPRCQYIYGFPMYIFDSENELDPWRGSELRLSYEAFANSQAYELWRSADFEIQKARTVADNPALLVNIKPPSSNVSARTAILEVAAAAEAVLYSKLESNSKKNDELGVLWTKTRRHVDFFSDTLKEWLPYLDDDTKSKLGYDKNNKRMSWVEVFERIRNRFVHRGPYFLEKDFVDMKACNSTSGINSPNPTNADVFADFVYLLTIKIKELSGCGAVINTK